MGEFESRFFHIILYAGLISAACTFVFLLVVPAPYGRYSRSGWGPNIPARLGWILMESVSLCMFLICFAWGAPALSAPLIVLAGVWTVHYAYRAVIFPLRIRETGKKMPLLILASAVTFNLANGYLNGRYLGVSSDLYTTVHLSDLRFLAGMALVVVGAAIHLHSDNILIQLRKPGETGYQIPRGGLYRWVSSPNYLGEIIEWTGFALAAWSLPGLYFALWTAANLAPRAFTNHRWYRRTFDEYPPERKALIPGIL